MLRSILLSAAIMVLYQGHFMASALKCQSDKDCPKYTWCYTMVDKKGKVDFKMCERNGANRVTGFHLACGEGVPCHTGFNCEEKEFRDGPASVCVPEKWYRGGGGKCQTEQDCGFTIYHSLATAGRWVPCVNGKCQCLVRGKGHGKGRFETC